MSEKNTLFHIAYAYWLESCCHRKPQNRAEFDDLLESFNRCMERTKLFRPHVGPDKLRLMLEHSGFRNHEDTWQGVSELPMEWQIETDFPKFWK